METGAFSYSSVMGDSNPQTLQFHGDLALLRVKASTAQQTIGHFKDWLRQVNEIYRDRLRRRAAEDQQREAERIRKEIQKAEEEARVAEALRKITF
jgi:hypothetical protein